MWGISAIAAYGVIAAVDSGARTLIPAELFRPLFGVLYFLSGVVLLGWLGRYAGTWGPDLWRTAALLAGAVVAALEVWLAGRWRGEAGSLDDWMAALLGLAAAVLLPRLLPERWLQRWLGMERRRGEH